MTRSHCRQTLFLYMLLAAFFWITVRPAAQGLRQTDLVKITENVYASMAREEGDAGANAGFVITDKWVCIFDAHFTSLAGSELVGYIRGMTPLPMRYLVNSHYHGDHTHGNQALPLETEVIGTHSTWTDLLNKDLPQLRRYQQLLPDQISGLRRELQGQLSPERTAEIERDIRQRQQVFDRIADLEVVLPGVTFEKSLTLRTLDKEVQLLHLGRGHTAGDTVLWLPVDRVLFAGDLVFPGRLPNMFDSHTAEWIETLGQLRTLRPEVVVPGHGPIGDDSMLSDSRDYLSYIRRTVKANMDQEMTLEDMLKNMRIPVRFQKYKNQDLFPSNIDKVYRELREEAAAAAPPPAKQGQR